MSLELPTPLVNYDPIDLPANVVSALGASTVDSTPTDPTANSAYPPSGSNLVQTGNGLVMALGTMQSSTFVSGSQGSGWQIAANGDVQFNNGFFRGDITGASGTFSGSINAASGFIGGWTIGTTTLTGGGVTLNSGGTITAGTGITLNGSTQQIIVGSSSPTIIIDGSAKTIGTSTFSASQVGWQIKSDGSAEFNNLVARGQFQTQVLAYGSAHVTAGTNILALSGGSLLHDATSVISPTTFNVDILDPPQGHLAVFSVNDILHIKDGSGNDNWWLISSVSDQTTFYRYVCTLSSGSVATFRAGAAVADYGQSGQGLIINTVDMTNAPYMSIQTHAGSPWSAVTEQLRIGNLNGTAGFVANTFGIFIGNYSTGKYLTYDSVSSNLVINGYIQNGKGTFGGDGSDGALLVTSGTTNIDLGGLRYFVKNYSSITISGTGKVTFSNHHTNGTFILLKSQGNVTLTSSATPMLDASGMGTTGGAAVNTTSNVTQAGNPGSSANFVLVQGLPGTNQTTSAASNGGAQPTNFSFNAFANLAQYDLNKYQDAFLGIGGGSGSVNGGNNNANVTSGKGGDGGAFLGIECGGAWNFTTTNGISVAGKDAGNGVYNSGTQNNDFASGGAGGGGGQFKALYRILTANTGSVTVSAGVGGTALVTAGTIGGPGSASNPNGAGNNGNTGVGNGGQSGANGIAGSSSIGLNSYFA